MAKILEFSSYEEFSKFAYLAKLCPENFAVIGVSQTFIELCQLRESPNQEFVTYYNPFKVTTDRFICEGYIKQCLTRAGQEFEVGTTGGKYWSQIDHCDHEGTGLTELDALIETYTSFLEKERGDRHE